MERRVRIAIIGIGNTLAGDDGAGIEVVRRLKETYINSSSVMLHTLEGDLFEITDWLDRADRFIFIDATVGEVAGEIRRIERERRPLAPSFHQSDIASVMQTLETLKVVTPFPSWEIWGITVKTPFAWGERLSPEVISAVERLHHKIEMLINEEDAAGR